MMLNGKHVRGFGVGDAPSNEIGAGIDKKIGSNLASAAIAGVIGAGFGAGMSYADTKTIQGSAVAYGAAIGVVGALVAIRMR